MLTAVALTRLKLKLQYILWLKNHGFGSAIVVFRLALIVYFLRFTLVRAPCVGVDFRRQPRYVPSIIEKCLWFHQLLTPSAHSIFWLPPIFLTSLLQWLHEFFKKHRLKNMEDLQTGLDWTLLISRMCCDKYSVFHLRHNLDQSFSICMTIDCGWEFFHVSVWLPFDIISIL